MEYSWHHLGADETLTKLKTSRRGLATDEALRRRTHDGPNVLPREQPLSLYVLFFRQFRNPLVTILLAASAVSFGLGDILDANVILVAVAVNVAVGFFQEAKAERALAAMHDVITFRSLVLRDGREVLLDSTEIVPGDILILKTGDRIPADARLLHANELQIDESALTGESFPVPKEQRHLTGTVPLAERTNMVFQGTTITQGGGTAIVVATGMQTEFGAIASLLRLTPDEPTPLQRRLTRLGRLLSIGILSLCLFIFLLGLGLGKPLTAMFSLSVAVAVAAIPEGLPAAVTVILAIGMQRILARKALVRRLVAAETLGSTTVICTDKTGTLTEGEMSVVRLVTDKHDLGLAQGRTRAADELSEVSSARLALTIGLLCNDAHIENEDRPLQHRVITGTPTDRALVYAAHADGLTRKELEPRYRRIETLPFDSARKFMMTLHHEDHHRAVTFFKGAVERVLERCASVDQEGMIAALDAEKRSKILASAEGMSGAGLRVLAFAFRRKNGEETLKLDADLRDGVFVGMVGIKDPLRATAKATVERCQRAGIRVVMLTGDHPLTARVIGNELGLATEHGAVMTGDELAALDDYHLERRIADISIYARVTPKDKIRLVDAWQARGEVVAMTGDGVNDAPALRGADIGIALGSGTDVAKETADVVLLDSNISTIVAAVEQGRVIYENIRKVVLYLLSGSLSEVIVVCAALVTGPFLPGLPLPLLAAQILWINLVTDSFPSIALTVEPEEQEVMQGKIRSPRESLLNKEMRVLTATVSLLTGGMTFALFLLYYRLTGDETLARTVAFAGLGMTSLLSVLSVRTLRRSLITANPFANPFIILAVLLAGSIQVAALYFAPLQRILGTVPLGVAEWTLIALMTSLLLLSTEVMKRRFVAAQSEG